MDKYNFKFELVNWSVVMSNGKLEINGCEYEENDDDPTYDFARWIAAAMGLI